MTRTLPSGSDTNSAASQPPPTTAPWSISSHLHHDATLKETGHMSAGVAWRVVGLSSGLPCSGSRLTTVGRVPMSMSGEHVAIPSEVNRSRSEPPWSSRRHFEVEVAIQEWSDVAELRCVREGQRPTFGRSWFGAGLLGGHSDQRFPKVDIYSFSTGSGSQQR